MKTTYENRYATTTIEHDNTLYSVVASAEFKTTTYEERRPFSDEHDYERMSFTVRTSPAEIISVTPFLDNWSPLHKLLNLNDDDFE